MASFISKIMVFITVLISMIVPGNVNNAPVTVDNQVTVAEHVIKYTYTNKTGYVISNDCRVEKLEVKAGDNWADITDLAKEDAIQETAFEVYPGKTYSKSYDPGLILIPGSTYRITVAYNVVTAFDGTTTVGHSSAEFLVARS